MQSSVVINLEKVSKYANMSLPLLVIAFFLGGYIYSFYFHFLTVFFIMLTAINFYYRHLQKGHALLSNFGFMAQFRYIVESVGPELRQYLFTNDTEERPFNRIERAEVYRKSKNVDSSSAFGSQLDFDGTEYKLRHSMYPIDKKQVQRFHLSFGEERDLKTEYLINKPVMISAMSYGSLGSNAVRALARGAKRSGIAMNTGEGGYPKYHLMEDCDLIFQMGTAKFGVRNEDGSLNPDKLEQLSKLKQVRMIEIKFSQGAKPGKGGILPKEKITQEISDLRGVPMGEDVISPAFHIECSDAKSTVRFIKQVQEISGLPVGIKMCMGRPEEFCAFVATMRDQLVFPDYIAIDGAEGGTGAAPRAFMDDIGVPLFKALPFVHKTLKEAGLRDRMKLICAGKLISPGKQFMALSLGAQACYTARGFMLAIGCIQALQCNTNTCPVGITTHHAQLQGGLDIESKAQRVVHYVNSMNKDYYELMASLGKKDFENLGLDNLLLPEFAY